jgi:ubiquitin carboxyl-terminal hydrolase 34
LEKLLDGALLERLLQLLHAAKTSTGVPNSVRLVTSTFEAMLEASFHSSQFWAAFKSHIETPQLLRELLLEEDRTQLRKVILKQISSRLSWASRSALFMSLSVSPLTCHSLSTMSTIDFSMFLWPILVDLIPHAVKIPVKCEETLSLALQIFRKLADTSVDSVDVQGCLINWGTLLVNHTSHEVSKGSPNTTIFSLNLAQIVGRPDALDTVTRCLASLLYWCASFAKASRLSLPSK